MKCFESPSGLRDPMMWHKRQSIRDFVKQKPIQETKSPVVGIIKFKMT